MSMFSGPDRYEARQQRRKGNIYFYRRWELVGAARANGFLIFGIGFALAGLIVAGILAAMFLTDTENPYARENLWVSGVIGGCGLLFAAIFVPIGIHLHRVHRRGNNPGVARQEDPPARRVERSTTTTTRTDTHGRTVRITEEVTRGPDGTTRTRSEQVIGPDGVSDAGNAMGFPGYDPDAGDDGVTDGRGDLSGPSR